MCYKICLPIIKIYLVMMNHFAEINIFIMPILSRNPLEGPFVCPMWDTSCLLRDKSCTSPIKKKKK